MFRHQESGRKRADGNQGDRTGGRLAWSAAAIAFVSMTAQAQVQSPPPTSGPATGFPGERAGTGSSIGTLNYMHDLEKFAFDGSGSPEAKAFARQAAAFLAASSDRRQQAFALGMAAQRGEAVQVPAGTLRKELEQDLVAWRNAFGIPRSEYRAIHDKLLSNEGDLTPAQWAIRRAGWFQARDQWVEQRKRTLGIAP